VTGSAARRVAIDALVAIERDDSYANLRLGTLLDRSGLDERDRGFVTEIVYGTIRRRATVDHLVDRFLSSEPPPIARAALRIGAYQLHVLGVPPHAAVAATVEATPKRFRGLVNAVLRRVSSSEVSWPDDATRLSYPAWLVDRLVADLGRDVALAALDEMNRSAPAEARADGYMQDRASQWVAEAVGARPGDLVVDLCAAPGGKSTAMAAAGATVLGLDLHPHRAALVQSNAERLSASVAAVVADGRRAPLRAGCADRVLVDAPCSGLGVLRRRADARWRVTPSDIDRLVALQRELLEAALRLVRPGGTLVYSVCTLTSSETVGVAGDFEAAHSDAIAALAPPGTPWEPIGSGARLLPQSAGTDGMAVFRWQVGGPSAA
jgi:16S rRNA (cytosine967-C5)-methyltransferase